MAILSVPTLVYLVLSVDSLQEKVLQRIGHEVFQRIDSDITFDKVSFNFFNKVEFTNLCVYDQHKDTLLFVPELIAKVDLFRLGKRELHFGKIILNGADIRLRMDPDKTFNSQFLLNALKSRDSLSPRKKWDLSFRNIQLNEARFSMQSDRSLSDDHGRDSGRIDFSRIDVRDLTLYVSRLTPLDSGGVSFRVNKLRFKERSGFDLTHFSADVLINPHQIRCRDMAVITPRTTLVAPEFSLRFPSFKSLGRAFPSEVDILLDVPRSAIALGDVAYFVPLFRSYPEVVEFSGNVEGKVKDLRLHHLNLALGNTTIFRADVKLVGLPDIRSTMIYVDCKQFSTVPSDLQRVRFPNSPTGHMILPGPVKKFAWLSYTGKFTGFYDNFVAYGTVTSNLGTLVTDMWIKPVVSVKSDTTFRFSGSLEALDFALGTLLEQPYLGSVSMKGRVDGSATRQGNVDAQVDGVVQSIMVKGYEYKQVALNGTIKNQTYDGSLQIDDKNLKMNFLGKVDLSEQVPRFVFSAQVAHAQLNNLHLIDRDSSAFASFAMQGDFSGTNIDQMQGEVTLQNMVYTMDNKTLKMENLLLFTKQIDSINRFILRSDIVHAEVWGKYEFLKLPQSFMAMLGQYLPSLVSPKVSPDSLSQNNFKFELEFVNTDQLTNFLADEFFIAEGTRMEGVYDPSHQNVSLELKIPYVDLSGKRWTNLVMRGHSSGDAFAFEVSCSNFGLNNRIPIENLRATAIARRDSLSVELLWNASKDPQNNSGHLNAMLRFVSDPSGVGHRVLITSDPDAERNKIVVNGSRWQLLHQGVELDSTSVTIQDMSFLNGQQRISVSGRMSRNPGEQMKVGIQKLDLNSFSDIFRVRNLVLGGVANGEAVLADVYHQVYFTSDISVTGFSVNGQPYGALTAKAQWDAAEREVHVNILASDQQRTIIEAEGAYMADDKSVDVDVKLDEVPMATIYPYVSTVFSRFGGGVSGTLNMKGPANAIVFNGSLSIKDLALTPDFTNSEYHLSGTVPVVNNQLQFNRVSVTDRLKNQATVSGSIQNEYFKDLSFNLSVAARGIEILNTTRRDNEIFYGTGFGSGAVRIIGSLTNITLDMELTTGRNSRFYIPLESAATVSGNSLITFVQPVSDLRSIQKRNPFLKQTPVVSVQPHHKLFTMKLTLNVTPDAETQLVFDPTIGDIMEGSGTGTLKFAYNSDGLFSMIGTFTVEQGKYESQFKSLLASKTFNIEKGGIISWDGDPLGAVIDVKGIYRARPSLSSLLRDQSATGNVDVDCILRVTNTLNKPDMSFDLALPNARQEVRSYLSSITSSDEEMMRQFSYLLAFNSFYSDVGRSSPEQLGGVSDVNIGTMGLASVSEFFSGQLSHMVSQFSDAVDVGVRYRPGTDLTGQDVEFNVSTDIINFTGNVGVGNNRVANTNNSVLGDFSMDVKVTRDGRLRFKAFNRSNESYLFEQAPYTQGIGLMYRQEFNRLSDLFRRKKIKPLSATPSDSVPTPLALPESGKP